MAKAPFTYALPTAPPVGAISWTANQGALHGRPSVCTHRRIWPTVMGGVFPHSWVTFRRPFLLSGGRLFCSLRHVAGLSGGQLHLMGDMYLDVVLVAMAGQSVLCVRGLPGSVHLLHQHACGLAVRPVLRSALTVGLDRLRPVQCGQFVCHSWQGTTSNYRRWRLLTIRTWKLLLRALLIYRQILQFQYDPVF